MALSKIVFRFLALLALGWVLLLVALLASIDEPPVPEPPQEIAHVVAPLLPPAAPPAPPADESATRDSLDEARARIKASADDVRDGGAWDGGTPDEHSEHTKLQGAAVELLTAQTECGIQTYTGRTGAHASSVYTEIGDVSSTASMSAWSSRKLGHCHGSSPQKSEMPLTLSLIHI